MIIKKWNIQNRTQTAANCTVYGQKNLFKNTLTKYISLNTHIIKKKHKSNVPTHAISTGHVFPDISNITFIKHNSQKDTICNEYIRKPIYI